MKNQENNIKNKRFLKNILGIFFVLFVCCISESFGQGKEYVVVLDAGHGGSDPGNVGNGYYEKNIALKVVKNIGKELSKSKHIKVVYTRDKDVLIDLWKRGEIANKVKADLFVSVHCNSHNSKAYGTETFVLGLHANKRNFEVAKKENAVILLEDNYQEKYKGFDPNSPESVIGLTLMQEENLEKSLSLATDIQKNFKVSLQRKSRGVKQAGFVVLYQTYMPSVLVELGFLTNRSEGRYLNSKKGQRQMSFQIASAIRKYINKLKLNTVSTDDIKIAKKQDKKEVVKPIVKEEIDIAKKDILFKVQIASSRNKISTKSYNFKGLQNIERVKVGKYYKYYYGNSSNYSKTRGALNFAKKKGYKSAFIAAFKNGEKISVKEALKS